MSVSNLVNPNEELQMDIFSIQSNEKDNNKAEDVTKVLDSIRRKYGVDKATFGSLTDI